MSRNNAVEFAAGFGQGYLNTEQRQKEEARRDRIEGEQKARQEKQDARQAEMDRRSLEASDLQLGEARAGRDLRLSLAESARPREVIAGAGGMVRPDTMDNRDVGLPENQNMPNQGLSLGAARVGNQTFATQPEAEKFAQAQDRPDAVMGRQSLDYARAGQPTQAAALDKQRREYAKWLENEGIAALGKAARSANPKAVYETFNSKGELRLKEPPQVKEVIREIPGLGKIKTYDYTGIVVSPDGSEQQVTKNSHDLSMESFEYDKYLQELRANQENDSKQDKRVADAEAKLKTAQASEDRAKTLAAAAELRAARGSGGGGRSTEEERKYKTAYDKADKEVSAIENRIFQTEQKEALLKTEREAKDARLMSLRSELEAAKTKRNERESDYLYGPAAAKRPAPTLADPKKNPTAKTNPAKMSSDYSNLWK